STVSPTIWRCFGTGSVQPPRGGDVFSRRASCKELWTLGARFFVRVVLVNDRRLLIHDFQSSVSRATLREARYDGPKPRISAHKRGEDERMVAHHEGRELWS